MNAEQLAEQVAETLENAPAWVVWFACQRAAERTGIPTRRLFDELCAYYRRARP